MPEDDALAKEERLQRVRRRQLEWETQRMCTELIRETPEEVGRYRVN